LVPGVPQFPFCILDSLSLGFIIIFLFFISDGIVLDAKTKIPSLLYGNKNVERVIFDKNWGVRR